MVVMVAHLTVVMGQQYQDGIVLGLLVRVVLVCIILKMQVQEDMLVVVIKGMVVVMVMMEMMGALLLDILEACKEVMEVR